LARGDIWNHLDEFYQMSRNYGRKIPKKVS